MGRPKWAIFLILFACCTYVRAAKRATKQNGNRCRQGEAPSRLPPNYVVADFILVWCFPRSRRGWQMTTYTYQTIDPPGSTDTVPESINSNGQIVGYYQDSNRIQHGFLDNNGTYSTIDPPGSVETVARSINAGGQIIGYYFVGDTGQQGFFFSHGIYTTINPPGSHLSDPISINDKGQIVGDYRDSNGGQHGFLYSNGAYTLSTFPGPSPP
jgi:probable HAF family extracellular repeat protein